MNASQWNAATPAQRLAAIRTDASMRSQRWASLAERWALSDFASLTPLQQEAIAELPAPKPVAPPKPKRLAGWKDVAYGGAL